MGDGKEAARGARCSLRSGGSLCTKLSVNLSQKSLGISLPANLSVLSLHLPFYMIICF